MIFQALLFYVLQSWKNHSMMRLRRLRQPKYLLGGLVGAFYMWFAFFRPMLTGHGSKATPGFPPEFHDIALSIGALLLLVFLFFAWVIPHERASLTFSEAEVAFLFPAPISRRTLIHFKLCKSQFGILFSALIFSLISRPFGGGTFAVRALGWWVILSTINLHVLASSFAMTMLMDRGISSRRRRIIILMIAAVIVGGGSVLGLSDFPFGAIR